MDRRRFLAGLAGSGAVLAGLPLLTTAASGCGAVPPRPSMGRDQADELVARLDRGLAAIRGVPRGSIAERFGAHPQAAHAEQIFRLVIEAAVVTDVATSVPRDTRIHDALATRLATELPTIDTYVNTTHAALSRMTTATRRRIDARMRAQPSLAMDFAGWLDEHASVIGVATESHLKLRRAAIDLTTRLRRQSSAAVIDDCVAKVEAQVARGGHTLSLERSIVSAAMIDAIWQQVEYAEGADGLAPPQATTPTPELVSPASAEVAPVEVYPHGRRWNRRWDRPGDQEIEFGAIMVGLICPLGCMSLGLATVIGLVVVIAGTVQNAEWNGESEVERRARERH